MPHRPKYRKLYTRVLSSDDFAALPDDGARLIWLLLPLLSCREGRGLANPSLIAADLDYAIPGIDPANVALALQAFEERGMIRRYVVDGRRYYQIVAWSKYQATGRERESPFPAPPPKGHGDGRERPPHALEDPMEDPAVAATVQAFDERGLAPPHWLSPGFGEDWVAPARSWARAFPEFNLRQEVAEALDFAMRKGYVVRSPRSLVTIMANRLNRARQKATTAVLDQTPTRYGELAYDDAF